MISVVIPVVNNYNLTDQLLGDIENNTIHPSEIILIDNASTENIFELVNKYKTLKIRYIRNPENIGVNSSWDLGRQLAQYEYIAILNNDIRVNKFFFEKIISIMTDQTIGLASSEVSKNLDDVLLNSIESSIVKNSFSICGNAYVLRKTISDEIGPIPKELRTFCGDNFIISRIDQIGSRAIVMSNNNIFHYRFCFNKERINS